MYFKKFQKHSCLVLVNNVVKSRHLPIVECLSVEGVVKKKAGGAQEQQQPDTLQPWATILMRHTGKTRLYDIPDTEMKKW